MKMKWFHKFMHKAVYGGHSIKISNKPKYLGFPKAAPWIVPGITLMGFFQESVNDNSFLFWLGAILAIIGIFGGFAYGEIFKKQAKEYSDNLRAEIVAELEAKGIKVPKSVKDGLTSLEAFIEKQKELGKL
jgi:hypothetical protein